MWFSACRCSAPLKFCRRALSTSIQLGCQSVKQILAFKDVNKAIEMKGWVRALRKHKDMVFVDLSDGSAASKVQVVVPANCVRPGLSYGSAIQVFGKLVASSHKGQELEVHAEDVTVLGPCDIEGYPFHPRKTYPPEYVRSFPHFRSRQAKEAAMLRLRSAALMAVHAAFQSQGFFHVHTPILTSNDCEGGGNVFTVKPMKQEDKEESQRSSEELFFGTPVFLTVSAQLHLEAVAMSLSRVYTVGPTFRAENCNTRRHVCEFCMVEAEEAFVTSLDTLLQRTEDVVKNVFTSLVNSSNEDVAVITKDAPSGHLETVQAALEKPFTRMTYSECINVLQSARNEKSSLRNIEWGQDLGAEHEEYLVKHCGNAAPLFVTHFPSALKPFYMKHSTLQPNTVEGFDLLAPFGGELCGGSLREDDHTVLEERLRNLGIADAFPWYLDLRKYGSAPHGGFGLGFDRMLQYFFAIQNIRDVVTFPRWSNHCSM
ncbi:asparagine--tRNA ligase, mitochondrial [Rhipicephalus microplus]|uniref:asparagine--tRNA ligase n=1 Tax=Rhipicephalus microplus TaxID=6941 RepID=A0A6M2CN95_RHIMP|nr:probable asparagine--tRNA ligase, mitochondrial [Rhipicephalus microplus]